MTDVFDPGAAVQTPAAASPAPPSEPESMTAAERRVFNARQQKWPVTAQEIAAFEGRTHVTWQDKIRARDRGGDQQPAAADASAGPDGPAPVDAATKHKIGDFEVSESELREFIADKAARESGKLTAPARPDDFKLELSRDFKAPVGVDASSFRFDESAPETTLARNFAHRNGLSQDQFAEMLGIYAGMKIREQQEFKTTFEGEKTKLGAAAQSRMDTVSNFAKAMSTPERAQEMLGGLWSAKQVEWVEDVMSKFRTQGAGSYSTTGSHAPPPNGQIEGYDKMSFAQRRAAQDAMRNRQAR